MQVSDLAIPGMFKKKKNIGEFFSSSINKVNCTQLSEIKTHCKISCIAEQKCAIKPDDDDDESAVFLSSLHSSQTLAPRGTLSNCSIKARQSRNCWVRGGGNQGGPVH